MTEEERHIISSEKPMLMLEAYSPAQLSFFLFQCLEPEIIHSLNFLLCTPH